MLKVMRIWIGLKADDPTRGNRRKLNLADRDHLLDLRVETTALDPMIGTLGVAVHTSGTVDETVRLNCDLK